MEDPVRAKRHSEAMSRAWDRGVYDNVRFFDFSKPSSLELLMDALLGSIVWSEDYIRQFRPENCRYTYDFYVPDYNLLVEVDGWYWHDSEDAKLRGVDVRDSKRDAWALLNGYDILRVKEAQITDSEYVLSLHEEFTTVM